MVLLHGTAIYFMFGSSRLRIARAASSSKFGKCFGPEIDICSLAVLTLPLDILIVALQERAKEVLRDSITKAV